MRGVHRVVLSPAEIDAIPTEALRREPGRIISREETAQTLSEAETDARIAAPEAKVKALQTGDVPATLWRSERHLRVDTATLEPRVEDGGNALPLAHTRGPTADRVP